MLPNHAPLVIAEQFGTLESLYPGRIDLGIGRAPGTDQRTARALRRDLRSDGDTFPQDVLELQAYFASAQTAQAVRAVPGSGLKVPLWILGSSLFGAQLAAALGLPFAFASHFAPEALMDALHIYRNTFKPSEQLARPYTMAGVNVFAAETNDEARRLFTSLQQQFINLRRGTPGKLKPPVDDIRDYCSPHESAMVESALRHSMVGEPQTVRRGLAAFIEQTGIDELMVTGQIYDHSKRLTSFKIAAQLLDAMKTGER
jgi:luciferase family oxidoreductase group 1